MSKCKCCGQEVARGKTVYTWKCEHCDYGPCTIIVDSGMIPHQCPFFSKPCTQSDVNAGEHPSIIMKEV